MKISLEDLEYREERLLQLIRSLMKELDEVQKERSKLMEEEVDQLEKIGLKNKK